MAYRGVCNGNGSTSNSHTLSLTEFPKPDETLAVLTIDPGKDVITELTKFSKACGALYTEKATGTVSCATLHDPKFKTSHRFNVHKAAPRLDPAKLLTIWSSNPMFTSAVEGSYIIVNIYGNLHENNGLSVEDGLWVLLGNKNGDAFWGRASKPLTAETPVKVWIVR